MKSDAPIVGALARVLAGGRVEAELPRLLRASPELDDDGRARVARRLIGTAVLRLRLAHLAGSDEPRALLHTYIATEEEGAPVSELWPSLAVKRSCPPFLVDALVRALGLEQADAFLAASNVPGPRTLRARGERAAVAASLAAEGIQTRPGALSPWALHVEGKANLFGSRAWRDGAFEVQDEASQLVALACAAEPGMVVVDLCAGRGGKTLALAHMMQDRGVLYVHDTDERALADMQPRLRRAGVRCVQRGLPAAGSADVVLVDAPCSSLGALRRSPDLRFHLTPDDLLRLPPLQRRLLAQAHDLARSGGRVVYATCTVLREENDDVAGAGRLLLPHTHGTDGFFIAVRTV